MLERHINGPYAKDLQPALATDAYVEIQPNKGVYQVDAVEVIPTVETQEFSIDANDLEEEIEIRSLYAQDSALAQFRLLDPTDDDAIPDGIRITVDHGGEESPRFNLKNERGFYTNETASYGEDAPQTELWQYEDTDLFFTVENTTGDNVDFTLLYTGYLYDLTEARGETPDTTVLTERRSFR